jgi:enolase 1/2/3
MATGSMIESVRAREILTARGHPGIEATVATANGRQGVAVAVAGTSIGEHEVQFAYDGGGRFGGKGVLKAVNNVTQVIAPALIGSDAANQRRADAIMLELDGTPEKSRLGGNAIAAVSGAVLKAGAASLGVPLYQHIGGINACVLPTPDVPAIRGSTRYGGGERSGGKPTYTFLCYGYDTFSDAAYAGWEVTTALHRLLRERFRVVPNGAPMFDFTSIQGGIIDHDREIWELMVEAIRASGNEGKIGFQVDMAASTYYDRSKDKFVGIFSREDKTRADMIELYDDMVSDYPFVIIEDPLDENDYEGHAILTKELGINIIGDDLFTTSTGRLMHGIQVGACNTLLLKVNQIGSVSEAFDAVQLAFSHGYSVAPCASRGEGEAIADYGVGLNSGIMSGGGIGGIVNRFTQIEAELGTRARFSGKAGLKAFKNRTP